MENKGKLYRSRKDVMVSGVCSGIANSLGIDPTIVRLLWAISVLFFGTGFLAYILCAIIIPKEPLASKPSQSYEFSNDNSETTRDNDYNI